MVTSRDGVSDKIPSDKLQQRDNSDTGFHESVSNQKGSPLSMLPEKELGKLQQRQSPSTEALASQSSQAGSARPMMPEKVSNSFQQRQSHSTGIHASQSNQEGSSPSVIPEKELDILHQRQSPNDGIHASQSDQEGRSLSTIPEKGSDNFTKKEKEPDNLQQRQRRDMGIHASESNQEGKILSIIPKEESGILQQSQGPDTGVPASQSDQEKLSLSMRPEKVLDKLPLRRNPDIGIHVLQSDQEANTPSRIPEKASEDGYNWRKYGQKLVRGNQFIRSYYKCTFPNCPAKKQVERSHSGPITDIKYLRKHEHPKPQNSPQIPTAFVMPIQSRRLDEPSSTISEDESSDVHVETSHHIEPTEAPQILTVAASDDVVESTVSQSNKIRDEVDNDGEPDSKRQKRDISSVDDNMVYKTNGEPRLVVQTRSEVDIVNDGFRWRKYGQKLVKGNPNPRSYYRCSSAGCPVKKHVERASHDPKVVITTYEGTHDHGMPPGRTVTHNTGTNTSATSLNGESRSNPEDNKAVGLDMVVHVSAT